MGSAGPPTKVATSFTNGFSLPCLEKQISKQKLKLFLAFLTVMAPLLKACESRLAAIAKTSLSRKMVEHKDCFLAGSRERKKHKYGHYI